MPRIIQKNTPNIISFSPIVLSEAERATLEKVHIVYSVPVHESIECFIDMVENIKYFNKDYKIKIICNPSENLIIDKNIFDDVIIFNNNPKNRKKDTYDVLGAHVDNFIQVENTLNFGHFIPLASNSMFCKNLNINIVKWVQGGPPNVHNDGMIACIGHILQLKGITIHNIHRFLEGVVYKFEEFQKIKNFIVSSGIHAMKHLPYIAEETLIPILELNFFNEIKPHITQMLGGSFNATIETEYKEQINSCIQSGLYMVKPVPRIANSEQRKYLKSLMH